MSNHVEIDDATQAYNAYRFLYPVRAGTSAKVAPALLPFYEKRGWVAQVKKNGTSNVIAVTPDRTLICAGRDGEPHKLWTPTPRSSAAFKAIPGKGWWVFVAELLHSKVAGGPTDTNYLHDCLVADGRYLLGHSYAERYDLLTDAFAIQGETDDALKINDNTFILANFVNDFRGLFNSLTDKEDEGIVLKDPSAKLRLCDRENANAGAQIKCRLPHARSGAF